MMKISKSKFVKSAISILLVVMMLLSAGMSSIIAATVDMVSESANVDLAETGENSIESDGSYRLYFQFRGGSEWWNNKGCYHYAWVTGDNMTPQWRKIYKVGDTSNASTDSKNDYFYMTIPEGTLTGMKLIRGKRSDSPTEGSTSDSNEYYNITGDLKITNSIGTYNLITAVTENSSTFTHEKRYVDVSSTNNKAEVKNAISGSGTSADPYIVTPGQTMDVTASCTRPDDHNFQMRYGYNSSSTYSDSTTGTVTAASSGTDTKSFDVYFTPCLNGTTDPGYLGKKSSVTVYYKLQESKTYTVTFVDGAGNILKTQTDVINGEYATAPADPTRTGYIFNGWQIDGKGTVYSASQVNALPINADTEYVAQFAKVGDPSNYYLCGTFNNWTQSEPYQFTYTDTQNVVSLTLKLDANDGYQFKITDGTTWYSNTGTIPDTCEDLLFSVYDGYGNDCTLKASGGTYNFTFNTESKELTVTKAEEKVTVTFNNWDNSLIQTVKVTKGSTPTPPSVPEREGYVFLGWAETANASTPTIGTGNTFPAVSGDKTYYAVYMVAGETVTVTTDHTEGGTVYGGGNYAPGTEVTLKATPNTGYVFTSWEIPSGATLSNGYSLTDAEIKLIITGNVTVKANFTEQTASSYYLRGTFPDVGWDSGMNMTYTEEKVVSCTLTLDSRTYEFKIYDGTNLYGNGGTIKDTTTITSSNGWEFSKDNNNNCKLEATGGKYTFTFYTDTKRLIVERAKLTSTVTVYGTDGSISGVGTTTFKEGETVVSTARQGTYAEAEVKPNEYFTICTQINEATDSATTGLKYEWYVKGYVIKGKEFVEAVSMGNGLYSADIRLSADYEKADIVPIYFHTQAYLDLYGIDTTTFYAVIPDGIENWTGSNNYIGAYTWFYNPETEAVMYEPFGKYPGQLMIPITGLDGVYFTYVETSAPYKNSDDSKIYVDGVTLNNYHGTGPSNETAANIQTYDFYEFMSYTLLKRENITFVLKNHNTNYNKPNISGNSSITPGSFQFTPFVNYNNELTDIFGNVMTQAQYDAQVAAGNVLHVVRIGNKNYKGKTCGMNHGEGTCPLNGEWYVDAYIYGNEGNFITKGHSYQLSNGDLKGVLASYTGYAVKVSYEKSTVVNSDGHGEDNGSDATRYDGEWYADTNNSVEVKISVNVALSTDDGEHFDIATDAQGNKLNEADYGTALVNGKASVSVKRNEKVTLYAQRVSGYRFVGWATADGKIFSNNISETVDVAIATSYTAIYQELDAGQFYLNHYIYMGEGTADKTEIPDAHNGRGDLYVQIENLTQGTDTGLLKQNSVNLAATEGDNLRITIATDPAGIDTFFAWYVNAIGLTGTTYEEVGVDSRDNLAMPGNGGTYTNPNTVIGETGLVYFQFNHTVGKQFNLTLYSDIIRVTSNKKLIYRYNDRNMGVKEYVVNYELTPDEIVGFEGNNFRPYTPSDATITKFAPFVGDYYKDVDWVISDFSADECVLWGKNSTKLYDITSNIAGFVSTQRAPYNSVVNYDASELGFTSGGFWYKDINKNSTYDQGDPIIANGTTYSYRVTDNISIGYVSEKVGDFTVSVDNPVYGREQHTDGNGNNKSDKVVVDYMVNMVTPYVYGDGSGFTPWYNDKQVTDNWSGQMVTIESLEKAGYTVSFGVLLEQVDLNYVVPEIEYPSYDFLTFEEALADAQNNDYGKATKNVDEILNSMTGTTKVKDGKYYINYNRTDAVKLTNKNRYLFTIELDNTLNNRAAFYNVYAYMKVTNPKGETKTYISNVQTLNIHTTGTTNIA